MHFAGNIPKTWEIWGKMSYKSSQKATFYVAFPNIWDILVNLLHFCVAFFQRVQEIPIQNMCVLQVIIYGLMLERFGFPISAD